MAYEPINDTIYIIIIIYFALIAVSLAMAILMGKKWRERQVKAPLYLMAMFISFTAALAMLAVGLLETMITGYFKEIYRISLPVSYSLILLADVFLYMFAVEIVGKGKKAQFLVIAISGTLSVLMFLPTNWWGFPDDEVTGFSTRLPVTLALVMYSFVLYIIILVVANSARKTSKNKVAKTGLLFLMLSMVAMMSFLTFTILDTVLIVFTSHPGYSEFILAAWGCAFVFYIFIYISLAMPKRLQEKIAG